MSCAMNRLDLAPEADRVLVECPHCHSRVLTRADLEVAYCGHCGWVWDWMSVRQVRARRKPGLILRGENR